MSVTLKMVAEAAGVSVRTAGRVLSGLGPVSGSAAERVRHAAETLAYVPNAAARNLRRSFSRTAGVITSGGNNEVAHTRLRLLEEQLRNKGMNLLIGTIPSSQIELERMLADWTGFAEYVIFTAWPSSWNVKKLTTLPLHFLFLDCDPGDSSFDRLLTKRSAGIRDAVTAMIRSGCRRIAHVTGSHTDSGRMEGFDSAFIQQQEGAVPIRIKTNGLELSDGYEAGGELLRNKADGVFFDTDRMALGFYRYAHEHHVIIPNDIAVAGFDNDSASAYAIPALTTVGHPAGEEIQKAVEIITAHDFHRIAETICFPTHLILRESLRSQS